MEDWTLISDSLPPDDIQVIVATPHEVFPAMRMENEWYAGIGSFDSSTITHWRHFPANPNKYTVEKVGRKWLASFVGVMPGRGNRLVTNIWADSESEVRSKMDKFLADLTTPTTP